jgi:hypothetical protein
MTRECSLIDISLRGALFEAPHLPRPKVGDACSLDIPLDTGEARVKMVGQIAHVTGTRVGIRCTELDLDSAAHLRRLVQLNLGDEDMLQRELEALMDLGDE